MSFIVRNCIMLSLITVMSCNGVLANNTPAQPEVIPWYQQDHIKQKLKDAGILALALAIPLVGIISVTVRHHYNERLCILQKKYDEMSRENEGNKRHVQRLEGALEESHDYRSKEREEALAHMKIIASIKSRDVLMEIRNMPLNTPVSPYLYLQAKIPVKQSDVVGVETGNYRQPTVEEKKKNADSLEKTLKEKEGLYEHKG